MSLVEFFFASGLAFTFIDCSFSSEFKILYNSSSILSSFLIHIATPFFSKNSAFSSSCPGIGLITIIGSPNAKLSVVVSPPGFVIGYLAKFHKYPL